MSLNFHEIAESNLRIQNPFSVEKLTRLAEICELNKGTRVLDLACGKGEMLCQWALRYGIKGTGVDISETCIQAAQERSDEMKVWSQVNFVVDDATDYPQSFHQYDIVSCLGASWLGGGLAGTLALMKPALKNTSAGLLIMGETFWQAEPPDSVCEALGIERDYLADLGELSDRFDAADVELVDMMISTAEEWDRYYAAQWMTVNHWLNDNPQYPEAAAFREWVNHNRRNYLKYERRFLGFGIFVLRTL